MFAMPPYLALDSICHRVRTVTDLLYLIRGQQAVSFILFKSASEMPAHPKLLVVHLGGGLGVIH